MKKLLTILLSLAMILSMGSVAFAEGGGDGTMSSEYDINLEVTPGSGESLENHYYVIVGWSFTDVKAKQGGTVYKWTWENEGRGHYEIDTNAAEVTEEGKADIMITNKSDRSIGGILYYEPVNNTSTVCFDDYQSLTDIESGQWADKNSQNLSSLTPTNYAEDYLTFKVRSVLSVDSSDVDVVVNELKERLVELVTEENMLYSGDGSFQSVIDFVNTEDLLDTGYLFAEDMSNEAFIKTLNYLVDSTGFIAECGVGNFVNPIEAEVTDISVNLTEDGLDAVKNFKVTEQNKAFKVGTFHVVVAPQD